MSQEMRKAIVDAHNKLRHNLAIGIVQRDAYHHDKRMPNASNMRAMKYDCESEQKALKAIERDDCKILERRTAFEDLERNYGYISTTFPLHQAVKFLKNALVDAAHNWWNSRLYYTKFEGVTPEEENYPALPFFLMANAETEGVGCAVNFCPSSATNYYAVYCYYSAPHVKAGKKLYEIGVPCTDCPEGYQCYDELCRK